MFNPQDFGEKLKELRIQNGYSMLSLGKAIGTSASRIKSWEMGESVPSASWIVKLSNILQVSADELLLNMLDETPSKGEKVFPKKRNAILNELSVLLHELDKKDLWELYTLAELKALQKEVSL
ncbi:helix-turn-helix domain-containing protein [Rummeliibacillus sp. NPDC094406]|uniref:helix-turn-helix domain-containing protein n=1 Tax=Rummeliibacillus TaxID=648802 RepID=UPI0037C50B41